LIPDIPGVEKSNVSTAWDILGGNVARHAKNVIIIGGGMVGCETADFLADPGDNLITGRTNVTIIEMLRDIALDMSPEARYVLLERLHAKKVEIITSATIKEIIDDKVVIIKNGEEMIIHGKNSIVLAMGATSVDELINKIKDKVAEVYVVGDAKKPRKGLEAVAEGSEVGRRI